MKRLLIIEPQAGGHRMQYVRHLVGGARARGIAVTVATWEESLDHPAWRQLSEAHAGHFHTVVMSRERMPDSLLAAGASFRQQHGFHRMFADTFSALPPAQAPDHVIVPFLNLIDKIVPLLGSPFGDTPWSGIVMRDTFHHASMGIPGRRRRSDLLKKWLFLRLAGNRPLRALFTIDPALPEFIGSRYPRLAERVVALGDPVAMPESADRMQARRDYGLREEQVAVLVYGVLNERKRLDALIAAMAQPGCPREVVVLAVGRQLDDTRSLLGGAAAQRLVADGRIVQVDGYVTAEQEAQAFAAADLVWVGYREHYTMSGVLLQAGAAGLPVLACREGLIGWLTQRHDLGIAIDVDQESVVAAALQHLAGDSAVRAAHGANGRRLAESHSVADFCSRVFAAIGEEEVADR